MRVLQPRGARLNEQDPARDSVAVDVGHEAECGAEIVLVIPRKIQPQTQRG